jgi:glycosyltransferase involved in cell wall biosynthesis
MRIGMILDKSFPPDPRVENEAVSLLKNGHEIYLFCLNYGSENKHQIINDIQVQRYNSNKLIYKLSALAYTFPFYGQIMSKKIVHFLKVNKIEAIHIHDMRIAEAVFKANKKLNLPTVLDLHDNIPEIMKLYPHLQKFPGKQLISPKKWKEKEELFIRKASKIITVSKEFIEEVVNRTRISKGKILLVPNTVHQSFYKEAIFDKTIEDKYKSNFVVLYLGDTGIRRGLQTAIESLTRLKEIIANVKLVIVGESTSDSILKRHVTDLNLEDYVDFQGWRDIKLFPSYILASAVCISPLHRNIQHDVAYANKLFQYMSFGKPVLVSNATAQKNLIEKTNSGLVHEERNSVDFANKVLQLFEDKMFRDTLGNNGKRFVEEEFCWEKTSKGLINLYDNLN